MFFYYSHLYSKTVFSLLKVTSISVIRAGKFNEYYYISTDELYNLDFSPVS